MNYTADMPTNELPKRKPTRSHKIDYSREGVYFITICTKDKKHTLSHIVGDGALDVPRVCLTSIGEVVNAHILRTAEKMRLTIDRYVIMPNHIHLLLYINENGTSRAPSPTSDNFYTNALIPRFVSTFKRFANKEAGQSLFQRSFHDHVVRDRHDYRKIAAYIENNPLLWREDCFFGEGDTETP
ncbi:MAG: hypothetical protein E7650_07115 [Ruminococcaceae bacterium]|nr:hypothetical protein [Oscillospiraceae bacterium]